MTRPLLADGWDREKCVATLGHVKYIMEKQNLTFLETQVILSWLQCDVNYKLGNLAISNTIQELSEAPIKTYDNIRGYIQ